MKLSLLPFGREATIRMVDWAMLGDRNAKRLRELGFDEGVVVEPLHAAGWARDPIAVRIGRMTVAIRRAYADAILVEPVA